MSIVSKVGKFALALKVALLTVEAGNMFPVNHANIKNPVVKSRELALDIKNSQEELTKEQELEVGRLLCELKDKPGPYRERFNAMIELQKSVGQAKGKR